MNRGAAVVEGLRRQACNRCQADVATGDGGTDDPRYPCLCKRSAAAWPTTHWAHHQHSVTTVRLVSLGWTPQCHVGIRQFEWFNHKQNSCGYKLATVSFNKLKSALCIGSTFGNILECLVCTSLTKLINFISNRDASILRKLGTGSFKFGQFPLILRSYSISNYGRIITAELWSFTKNRTDEPVMPAMTLN